MIEVVCGLCGTTSPTEVRNFIWLVGYYRQFEEKNSLIRLTNKNVPFYWSKKCETTIFFKFNTLLTSAPILTFPF